MGFFDNLFSNKDRDICDNCENFHKGSEEDDDVMHNKVDDDKDTDRCKESDYKVNKDSWCINNLFKEK